MFHKKLIINILYFFLFFFPFSLNVKAQNVDYEKLSLDELDNGEFTFKDKKTGEKFCKIYIKKAKKENNIEALFRAYKVTTFYVSKSESFKFPSRHSSKTIIVNASNEMLRFNSSLST